MVTSAAETMMTLARELEKPDLGDLLEDVLLRGILVLGDLEPVVEREAGGPGAGVLADVVVEHSPAAPTPDSSYLEALLERLLNGAAVPEYVREFPFSIRGVLARVDVFIPAWNLVIEADGRTWHGRTVDREKDHRRDASLAARGIQVIRLTYSMLTEEPDECIRMILEAGRHRNA